MACAAGSNLFLIQHILNSNMTCDEEIVTSEKLAAQGIT